MRCDPASHELNRELGRLLQTAADAGCHGIRINLRRTRFHYPSSVAEFYNAIGDFTRRVSITRVAIIRPQEEHLPRWCNVPSTATIGVFDSMVEANAFLGDETNAPTC
jgi:hypothetical protein